MDTAKVKKHQLIRRRNRSGMIKRRRKYMTRMTINHMKMGKKHEEMSQKIK